MKLEKYLLHSFSEAPKEMYTLDVPTGSNLLDIIILPDGVYCLIAVPEIVSDSTEIIRLKIVTSGKQIPDNAVFFKCVDSVIENEQKEQGIVIFPFFKLG